MPGGLTDIFVAATRTIHHNNLFALHLGRILDEVGNRVRGLERGNDSFGFGEDAERVECFIVSRVSIFYPAEIA